MLVIMSIHAIGDDMLSLICILHASADKLPETPAKSILITFAAQSCPDKRVSHSKTQCVPNIMTALVPREHTIIFLLFNRTLIV